MKRKKVQVHIECLSCRRRFNHKFEVPLPAVFYSTIIRCPKCGEVLLMLFNVRATSRCKMMALDQDFLFDCGRTYDDRVEFCSGRLSVLSTHEADEHGYVEYLDLHEGDKITYEFAEFLQAVEPTGWLRNQEPITEEDVRRFIRCDLPMITDVCLPWEQRKPKDL